jgi:Nucleotidyl transferase AbiEii toxin, Type IV TA system
MWVLKGAGALLARLEHARHSKDIDVYFAVRAAEAAAAATTLRRALEHDLGDFFRFDVTKIVPLHEETKGSRVHVQARLGPRAFAVFHIDVVVGTTMSGEPDLVAPLTPLHIDGLVRPYYRTFPLADHLADKFWRSLGRRFAMRSLPTPPTVASPFRTPSRCPMKSRGPGGTREPLPTRPAHCPTSRQRSSSQPRCSTQLCKDQSKQPGILRQPAGGRNDDRDTNLAPNQRLVL